MGWLRCRPVANGAPFSSCDYNAFLGKTFPTECTQEDPDWFSQFQPVSPADTPMGAGERA